MYIEALLANEDLADQRFVAVASWVNRVVRPIPFFTLPKQLLAILDTLESQKSSISVPLRSRRPADSASVGFQAERNISDQPLRMTYIIKKFRLMENKAFATGILLV
jgi:hypothetical protein